MTTMQLECTDEQWEELLKVISQILMLPVLYLKIFILLNKCDCIIVRHNDPTMRGIHYKEWTHYSDWVEIFVKDRATGQSAKDVTDMANKVHTPETVPINNPQSEYAIDDKTNVNKQNPQINDE